MSDNDATRMRHRVADPLRSFVAGSFVYDLKAGGHFDEKSLWEIVDGLEKVADQIDREHERRMEQQAYELRRAFCRYTGGVIDDCRHGIEEEEAEEMRTATFYPNDYPSYAVHTYKTVRELMDVGMSFMTTQMCMLSHVKDYDLIRIVNSDDDVVEIRNNHDGTYECDRISRKLRRIHNFFHLWENGEFDK